MISTAIAIFLLLVPAMAVAQEANQVLSPPAVEDAGARADRLQLAPTTADSAEQAIPKRTIATPEPPAGNGASEVTDNPVNDGTANGNAAPDIAAPAVDPDAGNVLNDETAAPPDSAPSFLDDPAAVLTRMLEPERRSDLPHDLSPWGMFMAADWVVKAVMLGLAFASIATWTVWLVKSLVLTAAKARARRSLVIIVGSDSLDEAGKRLARRSDPSSVFVRAAEQEMRRSGHAVDHAGTAGLLGRIGSHLSRIEAQVGRRISRGTGVLATIGSTAPFVGLFGTVWGIMNAFIGISEAQTTNLAVVAPGIAEALLATAIGLVAAIPAVVIYNVFARSITGYRQILADGASGVESLVSRDLDLRKVPPDSGRPDDRSGAATAALAAE